MPETLIPDDGSRSPSERGHGEPADQDLSMVSEHSVGAGVGLDEAEEARYTRSTASPGIVRRTATSWKTKRRWIPAGTSSQVSEATVTMQINR